MPPRTDYLRPPPAEVAPFQQAYLRTLPAEGDVMTLLERQLHETTELLSDLPEGKADLAYAPGKWTVKEVLAHVMDAERIFSYRALRFARGDATPLAPFDENAYVPASGAAGRTLPDLLSEYHAVRRATLALFAHLPAGAGDRRGSVGGAEVTVRALAWTIAGHEKHHQGILRQRYLSGA